MSRCRIRRERGNGRQRSKIVALALAEGPIECTVRTLCRAVLAGPGDSSRPFPSLSFLVCGTQVNKRRRKKSSVEKGQNPGSGIEVGVCHFQGKQYQCAVLLDKADTSDRCIYDMSTSVHTYISEPRAPWIKVSAAPE